MLSHSFDSAAIERATFDRDSNKLTITFKSGGEYEYRNCEEKLFRGLCRAPSAGRYFQKHIRPFFEMVGR